MKYRTNRRKFLKTLGLGLISTRLPWKKFSGSGSHEQHVPSHAHQTGLIDRFRNIPVTDCHFHINGSLDSIDYILKLENILDACSVDKASILATSARLGNLNRNMILAIAKAAFLSRVYAGGGLVYHYPATDPKYLDLGEQARTLTNIGFDVFKMIEGKPEVREELGHPLDDAMFDPYWEHLSANGIPVIWHVADPWSGPEPPPEIKRVYTETGNVLDRYPDLKIALVHFYFLSHQLDRASELLERYPNVSFDLTPGPEMYANFSANPERTRDFFIRYQDRIIFGTDNRGEARNFGRGAPLEFWPVHKMIAMRTFLETDEAFRGWHYDLRGIQLPDEVLVKIYHENFYHLAGRQPKPLHVDRAIEACSRIVHLAERYAVIHDIVNEARNCIRWLNSIQST